MILKEAFRYQNYLSQLKSELLRFLRNSDNVLEVVNEHRFSVANKEKNDEVEITKSQYDINKVIKLIDKIVDEKIAVTNAISEAKKNCTIDIDALLEINKFKTDIADTLKFINSFESNEIKSTGTDYKFNANGEQLSYRYPLIQKSSINFDRKMTKGMLNTLTSDSTKVSNEIDLINVTLEVNFEPSWDIDTRLDEILEDYKVSN